MQVRVRYEGDFTEAKATEILPSLLAFAGLLEEVGREIAPEKRLNIYISSTSQGSFIIDLNLALDAVEKIKSILGLSDSTTLQTILTATITLIAIKQFLKGEKPKTIQEQNGDVVIINKENSTMIIAKEIYNISATSQTVDEYISGITKPLSEQIKSLKIEDREIGITLTEEDYPSLQATNPLFEEQVRDIEDKEAYLTVVKIVFAENRKWEFIYQGNKISAAIADSQFIQRLDSYIFKKGTKLKCHLKIKQIYDRKIEDYINKEYTIIQVLSVEPPKETKPLF